MFVMAKIKVLFTPAWNGIAASVRCVSSALVVLNARLPFWLRRLNKTWRSWANKYEGSGAFPRWTYAFCSCRSRVYVRGFSNNLCKPIEIYICARKKHPFTSYPAAKHPKTTYLRLQIYDKNHRTFLLTPHGCLL